LLLALVMSIVPQRIKCDGCGEVLYEGAELKSPFEIIATYDGKCSKCGRKLLPIPIRVDIKTLELKATSS
jgi:hypothetical protein